MCTAESRAIFLSVAGVFVASGVWAQSAVDTVQTYDNLTNQLSYYRAGEQVEVVVARAEGGQYQEQTLTVTLGARSDAQSSTQSGQ